MCPMKSLACLIHTILQDGGTIDTLLYKYECSKTWDHVKSADMIAVVSIYTKHLKLYQQGIYPDLVGSHSLQAGVAMALKLHGYDDTTIKTIFWWTSSTFLQYIQNQIAHIPKDVSKHKSITLPFINIAAVEGIHA